jgi:diadenylate cyclase
LDIFNFDDIKSSLLSVLESVKLVDVVDILVVAFILYKGISLVRETRAGQLLKGIMLLVAVYLVAKLAELKVLQFVLKNILDVGLLAFIIIFQPELRRILEKFGQTKVGTKRLFSIKMQDKVTLQWYIAIDEICEALEEMSATFTGALIVIEGQTKLGEQIATGTTLNASPTKELLLNIFFKNTPLHDGALIVRDGMLLAAGCFLPKPMDDTKINKKLGSRHRAAIGMSENSDAIIIIVSEETGFISIAEKGNLTRNLNIDYIKSYLTTNIIPNEKPTKLKKIKTVEDIHSNIDFNNKKD